MARKVPPSASPSGSMAWPTPPETCHCTLAPAWPSAMAEANSACAGIIGSASPWTSRIGGASGPSGGLLLRAREQAGIADDRGRLHRAGEAHLQRHHCALAESHQREAFGRKFETRQLAVEKLVERAGGALDALLHLGGIEPRDGKPLKSRRRTGTGLGRVGRDERNRRQQALPMRRQPDEIVAVGAIAMTQHDEMRGGPAQGRQARAVQRSGAEGHDGSLAEDGKRPQAIGDFPVPAISKLFRDVSISLTPGRRS